jgi:hypothetical protein
MTLRRKEPRALVEQDRALNYAQIAVRRAWAGNVEDLQNWATAEFESTPLVIFDLNGEPLFYEFTVRDGRQIVGRVKAAASRLIGSTVVTIERGARKWDPEKAMAMATDIAKRAYPRRQLAARDLVCYSYPKIGVRVEFVDDRGGSLIYDVADGSPVQEFGSDALEGQTAWSFLEAMSPDDLERRLRRFEESDRELEAVRRAAPEMFSKGFTAREVTRLKPKFVIVSDYTHFEFYSSKVLKYAPRCTPHDCFMLYAQQTNVYCAVATGQMILDFYRYHFDQPTIAAAMGTGASGTSFAGQVTGYETLSNGCLTATHDSSADWAEARAEINANRPLKSGIPGHARACAGWNRQNFMLIGGAPIRWLQIYDPWPWDADICAGGAVYWEDWDAVNHTNFCYVRHNTTSHA